MNQQSKRNLTNKIISLAGIMVFVFFIAIYVSACSNYLKGNRTRRKLFGATYMTMNNEFYKVVNNQIRMQVEKNGDEMITLDPALDQKKQNEQIKQLVKRKVDAIFLNSVDWKEVESGLKAAKAVEPGLVAAKKAKIPVIVIDSQVYRSDLVAMTIVSDNYKAGVLCAKEMMKQKDHANIVLLTHNAARSAVDRINGFTDTIKKNKNYKILASADTQGQIERALPKVDKIIEKYKNIDVVMGLNDPAAMGALAALDSKGAREGVLVYGIDGSPEGKKLIKEGMMTGTAAQSPKQMADTAINAAYKILQGKKVEKKKVISVQMITKKNVEQTDISRWQ